MKENSFFALWPYVAAALLVVGALFRYLLARRRPNLLAEEIAEAKKVFGGKLFWLSLVLTLAAHAAGLLMPRAILSWNASPARLYLLEGTAFAVGLVALITCAAVVWRHLGHSQASASLLTEVCDTVFLAILFVVIASGLLVAGKYRWGSSWGVMTLTPYMVSVFRGSPVVDFIVQMPFLVQLHVLSTFAAIALVPLTRLSVFLVATLDFAVRMLVRPLSAAGRAAEARVRKLNLSARFWPEED